MVMPRRKKNWKQSVPYSEKANGNGGEEEGEGVDLFLAKGHSPIK